MLPAIRSQGRPPLMPFHSVLHKRRDSVALAARGLLPNIQNSFGICKRQRFEEDSINETKDCRRGADSERKHQDSRSREVRADADHAETESNIARQFLHLTRVLQTIKTVPGNC